jgi:hypothetical protein
MILSNSIQNRDDFINSGSHKEISGNAIRIPTVKSITPTNGKAPIKISLSSTVSPKAPFITKQFNPNGGVIAPIAIIIVTITPNQMRLPSMETMIGAKTGIVSTIIEIASRKQPRIRYKTTIANMSK